MMSHVFRTVVSLALLSLFLGCGAGVDEQKPPEKAPEMQPEEQQKMENHMEQMKKQYKR